MTATTNTVQTDDYKAFFQWFIALGQQTGAWAQFPAQFLEATAELMVSDYVKKAIALQDEQGPGFLAMNADEECFVQLTPDNMKLLNDVPETKFDPETQVAFMVFSSGFGEHFILSKEHAVFEADRV